MANFLKVFRLATSETTLLTFVTKQRLCHVDTRAPADVLWIRKMHTKCFQYFAIKTYISSFT